MQFIKKFSSINGKYWLLMLFQMLEIFAFQNVILQMSIYIAQKDVSGGLLWDHTRKGYIFLVWALAQRLTPVILGSYADKRGFKPTMLFSFVFIIAGYWLMGTQREFLPFLIGAMVLGFGSGMFKPSIMGGIAHSLGDKNHKFGWGLHLSLFNLAVLLAIPFSKYMRSIGWEWLFISSAIVTLINFFLTLFLYDDQTEQQKWDWRSVVEVFKKIIKPKVSSFIVIMSGFTIIYMQFYETLPNFIYDWVDTSSLVKYLHLSDSLLLKTSLGTMLSYEWLYGINTFIIFISSFWGAWLLETFQSTKLLLISILISTVGLTICGNSNMALGFIIGIVIYTIGEMITNTNFVNFLDEMSSDHDKATHLSFINISFALGLGGGSVLGGVLYNRLGDKSVLAAKYLLDIKHLVKEPKDALIYMKEHLHMGNIEIRDSLWNLYAPYSIWYVFLVIGVISAVGMFYYSKAYEKSK